MIEKRLLQIVVALACLVPLSVGGQSILNGVQIQTVYREDLVSMEDSIPTKASATPKAAAAAFISPPGAASALRPATSEARIAGSNR